MSPWLVNVDMDRAMRDMKVRAVGGVGSTLWREGREWELTELLSADGGMLLGGEEAKWQR